LPPNVVASFVVALVSVDVAAVPAAARVGAERAGEASTAVAVSATAATHDPVRARFRFTGVSWVKERRRERRHGRGDERAECDPDAPTSRRETIHGAG